MQDIRNAPPTLRELFPQCKSLEEKAFKFLEFHWECGNKIRRTARRLRETHKNCRVHHMTIKNLVEFLSDTEVFYRFQAFLSDQVEDFFSGAIFTGLYEQYQNELKLSREMLKRYVGTTKNEKDLKTKADHEMALKWARHEKSILDKLANISLAVKGYNSTKDVDEERESDHVEKYREIYREADELESKTLDA